MIVWRSKLQWAKLFLLLLKDSNWWVNRKSFVHLLMGLEENLEWYVTQKQKLSIANSSKQPRVLQDGVFAECGVELSPLSTVEGSVFLETGSVIGPACHLSGHIYISSDVYLSAGVVIEGPAYIGKGTELGPNCFLNAGVYIGEQCHIGQGAEIKSSILLDAVKMYHFSYIGHSIIGRRANIAAGTIVSVRRFDGRPVEFSFVDERILVGQKGGALIGDDVQLGVNTLIPPGRQICPRVSVLPASLVKRDILVEDKLFKSAEGQRDQEGLIVNVSDQKADLEQALWVQVSNLWDKEADRFWTRNNILLLVNGGLIALLSTIKLFEVIVLLSIFGMLLSILWLWINSISKYYLNRWKPILKSIEREWDVKPITIIDDENDLNPIPTRYESTSTYMRWTICTLGIFWAIVFGVCLIVYVCDLDLSSIEMKRLLPY